jgi:hypothetical protein
MTLWTLPPEMGALVGIQRQRNLLEAQDLHVKGRQWIVFHHRPAPAYAHRLEAQLNPPPRAAHVVIWTRRA